jgi:hypothetical protein
VWSDTLFALERVHLLRLAAWGAACILVGTALLVFVTVRRLAAPLLFHFAVQCAAWGAAELALAGLALSALSERDFARAAQLAHRVWMESGLDIGYAAVGITLALCGWVMGRRLGAVGAGIAIVVQGLALLVLHLAFAGQIRGV